MTRLAGRFCILAKRRKEVGGEISVAGWGASFAEASNLRRRDATAAALTLLQSVPLNLFSLSLVEVPTVT